jgi:Na+-translocating ferredoxin:NAD+ oxidoreductase RnfG subunit
MKWHLLPLVPVAALIAPAQVEATEYLSIAQAQAALFPGARLEKVSVNVPADVREAMRARSGVYEPFNEQRIWKAAGGGFFVVDAVVGKHERITYAAAIDAGGAVRGIEILTYNESYGYEVRDAGWRAQFRGKTAASALQVGGDIRNVTGATLSCKHITQGVKRLLVLHQLVLSRL